MVLGYQSYKGENMKPTTLCLGCNKLVTLTRYRVLPKEHFAGQQGFPHNLYFPLCYCCKERLEAIVATEELMAGHHKECVKLPIPRYFHLLRDFVMGRI